MAFIPWRMAAAGNRKDISWPLVVSSTGSAHPLLTLQDEEDTHMMSGSFLKLILEPIAGRPEVCVDCRALRALDHQQDRFEGEDRRPEHGV